MVISPFRWLQRMKQSRGHGIHSPFAFDLITRVFRSPYSCYAFQDIKKVLSESGLDAGLINEFNYLSYRLVDHFKPKHILEINSGMGVNTLFLTAPASDSCCTCVEADAEAAAIAKQLQLKKGIISEQLPLLPAGGDKRYNALFVYLNEKKPITIDTLMALSHENCFWVFYPLNSRWSKQYLRNIVNDERARITFDKRDTGIVCLRSTYSKMHYYV